MNPETYHRKNHRPADAPFAECWSCGRDRAVCRSKIRFGSWAEADDWVEDYNLNRRWEPPYMTRYRCRWCGGWHMKTARDVRAVARMEKRRRKWLRQQRPAA